MFFSLSALINSSVKKRRRKWQPTPVFLPGESHGRTSLVGCSPWGLTESDTTEATWQQQSDLARIMTETLFQAMNNV